jgi:steroid Delta-isomerase
MLDSAGMKAVLIEYIEAFNAADAQRIVALFADDAIVEDPYGSRPLRGRAAVADFYAMATATGARLEIVAPPRGSHGNAATISFVVHATFQGGPMRFDVTDVMTFNAAGKIERMQAFWGPDDMRPA